MPGAKLFLLLPVRCLFLPVTGFKDVRYVGRFTKILAKNAGSESQPLATNPRSVRSNVGRLSEVSGSDRPFRALVWRLRAGVCYCELRRTLLRTRVNKGKRKGAKP
jgi:hypothetical protein